MVESALHAIGQIMPAHRKRRVVQHVMESESVRLVQELLPHEWVVREYKPDYGIDLSVEVFKYIDPREEIAESLGDFFFAQVKSVQHAEIEPVRVYSRGNVAKRLLNETTENWIDIDVIKFDLETDLLITVESMGHAVPVLFLLAVLDTRRVFFLCLNDLIDKVIIPADPSYTEKDGKTIYVPVKNEITADPLDLVGLRFYAKRPKFYSAFNLFEYQLNELRYCAGPEEAKPLITHFLRLLDRLDIWHDTEMWAIVSDIHDLLLQVREMVGLEQFGDQHVDLAFSVWSRMVSLSHNYEELCREWFLPTNLAQYLSYPGYPAK